MMMKYDCVGKIITFRVPRRALICGKEQERKKGDIKQLKAGSFKPEELIKVIDQEIPMWFTM